MANRYWAQAERQALSDLLAERGPQAPTLCAGWTTADLVAHLIVREHRPDAAVGILVPPLAAHTERVRRRLLASAPYPALVERFRRGPASWSPLAFPPVDDAVNMVEYFVHHEDVRRAGEGWEPRELPAEAEEGLWRRLRMARLVLRRLPVEITFADTSGRIQRITKGGRQVRVHGEPSELTMWALGRKDAARVQMTGEAEAINVLNEARWRL
jgi:uncharacterized protein (TIGR03085 family)